MTALIIVLLGIILFISGVLIYSTLSWGWVCFKFWSWFIVPIFISGFPNFPEITFIEACGMMLFINLFKNFGGSTIKKEYRDESSGWTSLIITPWLVLLVGWLFTVIFM